MKNRILLIIIILAVAAYLFSKGLGTVKPAYKTTITPSPTGTRIIPAITSFETKNNGLLKDYIDPNYGFRFSFPSELRARYTQTQNGYVKQWGFTENYKGVVANSIDLTVFNDNFETNTEGVWITGLPEKRLDYKTLLSLSADKTYELKSDPTGCTAYKVNGTKLINNIQWHMFTSLRISEKCKVGTWFSQSTLYITYNKSNIYGFKVNPYTLAADDKLKLFFDQIVSSFTLSR